MNAPTSARSDPCVHIRLDGEKTAYLPGEVLVGECSLDPALAPQVRRLKVSVLWHTEGKGDEASAVHQTWDFPAEPDAQLDPHGTWRFQTQLPPSPLSYDGFLLKIRWYVRVEALLLDGKTRGAEVGICLGEVAPLGPLPA
jgi:hypothetical protein